MYPSLATRAQLSGCLRLDSLQVNGLARQLLPLISRPYYCNNTTSDCTIAPLPVRADPYAWGRSPCRRPGAVDVVGCRCCANKLSTKRESINATFFACFIYAPASYLSNDIRIDPDNIMSKADINHRPLALQSFDDFVVRRSLTHCNWFGLSLCPSKRTDSARMPWRSQLRWMDKHSVGPALDIRNQTRYLGMLVA